MSRPTTPGGSFYGVPVPPGKTFDEAVEEVGNDLYAGKDATVAALDNKISIAALGTTPLTPTGATAQAPLGDILGQLSATTVPNTVAYLGDSITATGFDKTATDDIRGARGYTAWINVLSRQRVVMPSGWNFGVAGEKTDQILARVGQVIAVKPGYCVVMAGTNDIGTMTADQTISNLGAIYDALQTAGIVVIAYLILPRADGIGADQLGKLRKVNQWINRQRLERKRFFAVDAGPFFADPVTGAPKTGYTQDNLHPITLGAFAVAQPAVRLLNTLLPEPPPAVWDASDVYDATNNPSGVLATNGMMTGTAGTLSGGPTGQLADGWTCTPGAGNFPSGISMVFSKSTFADGSPCQQVVISGTYNTTSPGFIDISRIILGGRLASGDTIDHASMEFEVDAGLANIVGMTLYLTCSSSTSGASRIATDLHSASVLPSTAFSGVMRTSRMVVPENFTQATVRLRLILASVSSSSPAALTIRFGRVSVRKVLP